MTSHFRMHQHLKLDRTRRAWVAPARDGRYVLGQLRSRTAGVSLRSILDGIVKQYLNDQEIEKSRLFWGPGKSFLSSQSSVFFGTLKIDYFFCRKNRTFTQAHEASVICPFFPPYRCTLDRLKLRFLNKKRRRCAPAQ